MDDKKIVRVGAKSEPAKVSSSILYILESGQDVEVSALGTSVSVLAKAICLVANLNNNKIPVSYIPSMEYITDNFGETRTACKFNIILKR